MAKCCITPVLQYTKTLMHVNFCSSTLQAPKAVLGPGTGLGQAIMVFERSFGGYRCSIAG
jgi:glucokinase